MPFTIICLQKKVGYGTQYQCKELAKRSGIGRSSGPRKRLRSEQESGRKDSDRTGKWAIRLGGWGKETNLLKTTSDICCIWSQN